MDMFLQFILICLKKYGIATYTTQKSAQVKKAIGNCHESWVILCMETCSAITERYMHEWVCLATACKKFINVSTYRAVAPTPASQAMARPVFSLYLTGLTPSF